jgi:hypothetical protein
MNNECIPFFEAAYTQKITVHAGYAMVGKTFAGPLTGYQSQGPALATDPLALNDGGNLICPAAPAAGGKVGGVIGWDVAINGKAPLTRGAGTILPVTAGGNFAIGANLAVDTQGRVVAAGAGNVVVGVAHSAGTLNNEAVVELTSLSPTDTSP